MSISITGELIMHPCALSIKKQYQDIIREFDSNVVFVSLPELYALHSEVRKPNSIILDLINDYHIHDAELPCVAYIYGSISTDSCCNGIRYGEGGEYISLPQLPSHLWIPF